MKICVVDGCNKLQSKGPLCGMHRGRMTRRGDLEIGRRENGTGNVNAGGYVDIRIDGVRKYVHVMVAELALGKPLPAGSRVHHVNQNRSDNRPENLMVCPSEAYHRLLHTRIRAMEACGNADWRKCWLCQKYDDQENLLGKRQLAHRKCSSKYNRARYARRMTKEELINAL